MLPAHLSQLPAPSAAAAAHSQQLFAAIEDEIAASGGWIGFARYMDLALHAPGLGYYSAGAHKLGAAGDFITAPELGALFARTLARQAAQILREDITAILEVGAGSGRLARDLLMELAALDSLPQRYLILETSAELAARQRALLQNTLPQFLPRVEWLERLPAALNALVIGNEVLDAMPVHLFRIRDNGIDEMGVTANSGGFEWRARPASSAAQATVKELDLPPGYTVEIHAAAQAFVRTLAACLARGVVLLIDYGFPAREYYHPQRRAGTLMCHYRHHAHADPLCLVGLQDITAHIDFSAITLAAVESGFELAGYASQMQFLINCGITEILGATPATDTAAYLPLASQAQKLLSPAEMGELFKVLALAKNFSLPLLGYASGDKQYTL